MKVEEIFIWEKKKEKAANFATRWLLLGSFRLNYEYEIESVEYEYDFLILVFRLYIITTHTHFIPWATLSTLNQHE